MLALPRLPAIPSASLVAVVRAALHPLPTPAGAAPPSLNTVLEAYLCAPCSAPLHRRAIHIGLDGTSDATRVLTVFADWLEAFRERGETGSGWGIDAVTSAWGEEERRAAPAPVIAAGKDITLASVGELRKYMPIHFADQPFLAHPTHPTLPRRASACATVLLAGT